jgi:hypothetical protein
MDEKVVPFGSDKDLANEIREKGAELNKLIKIAAQRNNLECQILLNANRTLVDGILVKKVL